MERKIWQCEGCKGYMDYEGNFVELQQFPHGIHRWCDDCIAKIKQRAVKEPPYAIAEAKY